MPNTLTINKQAKHPCHNEQSYCFFCLVNEFCKNFVDSNLIIVLLGNFRV